MGRMTATDLLDASRSVNLETGHEANMPEVDSSTVSVDEKLQGAGLDHPGSSVNTLSASVLHSGLDANPRNDEYRSTLVKEMIS